MGGGEDNPGGLTIKSNQVRVRVPGFPFPGFPSRAGAWRGRYCSPLWYFTVVVAACFRCLPCVWCGAWLGELGPGGEPLGRSALLLGLTGRPTLAPQSKVKCVLEFIQTAPAGLKDGGATMKANSIASVPASALLLSRRSSAGTRTLNPPGAPRPLAPVPRSSLSLRRLPDLQLRHLELVPPRQARAAKRAA